MLSDNAKYMHTDKGTACSDEVAAVLDDRVPGHHNQLVLSAYSKAECANGGGISTS